MYDIIKHRKYVLKFAFLVDLPAARKSHYTYILICKYSIFHAVPLYSAMRYKYIHISCLPLLSGDLSGDHNHRRRRRRDITYNGHD